MTVIPANADWKEFDPQVGFTTHLTSDDTIVLRQPFNKVVANECIALKQQPYQGLYTNRATEDLFYESVTE